MNKQRHQRLQALYDELEKLIEEEQDALDNRPDNIRDSEYGYELQGFIDQMETARDELSEIVEG